MKKIRGGMGLGDAFYVQAVSRHLVKHRGAQLKVCTAWPDVFKPLGSKVVTAPFTRQGIDILAHYSARKAKPTTQFQDVCITAGLTAEKVDLRLDWQPTSTVGTQLREKAGGRPIVCVQMPRAPMGRSDGFGADLMPDRNAFQRMVHEARAHAMTVLIGAGEPLYRLDGIDVDMSNSTTVSTLLDVAHEADAFVGYVSFILPMAESLGKPVLLMWSRRGLLSGHPYIRQITPKKVIHGPKSRHVLDNDALARVQEMLQWMFATESICA